MRKRTSSSGPQGPGSGPGRSGPSGAAGWGWGRAGSAAPSLPLSRAPMVCRSKARQVLGQVLGQPYSTPSSPPSGPHLARSSGSSGRENPSAGLQPPSSARLRSCAGRGWRRDVTALPPTEQFCPGGGAQQAQTNPPVTSQSRLNLQGTRPAPSQTRRPTQAPKVGCCWG